MPFVVGQPNQQNNVFVTQSESFPVEAEGLTGSGEILDLSGMNSLHPSSNVKYLIADYEFIPHRAGAFCLSGSVLPLPNWLRSWRWYYSSFREIAQRLSERQLIACAAGNHPPPAFFFFPSSSELVLLFFKWLFATVLSLFPWVPCFWMRALLVLSTGPCQPGCSAQPGPASATAASAKTLTRGLSVCLISPSYRSLICAREIFISICQSSLSAYFPSSGQRHQINWEK